jgi:prepilin-type N-terminal cleavage/methylation domain-containing protein
LVANGRLVHYRNKWVRWLWAARRRCAGYLVEPPIGTQEAAMRRVKNTAATGFTLVELLVVIAIIGTLVAMLLPAVQAAREAARRSSCTNNLRQIASAVQMYHDAHSAFPPGGISPGPCCSVENYTSWMIQILPFLEQRTLYDQYAQGEANESRVNQPVVTQFVAAYSCPSDIQRSTPSVPDTGVAMVKSQKLRYMPGSYRGVGGKSDGLNGWWDLVPPGDLRGLRYAYEKLPRRWRGVFHVVDDKLHPERGAAVRDGLSNTLMVGESTTRPSKRFVAASSDDVFNPLGRRTFWAYTYGSYNRSDVVPQSRTLLGDYDRCTSLGGVGEFDPCSRAWGSFHGDVLNFVLCDGSVHSFSLSVDMHIFSDAASIAGREYAPLFD